jgi:hypothetical protein
MRGLARGLARGLTGLRRSSKPLPDGNYGHLRGLEVQNISNNLQPSSSHEKSNEINQQATIADVEKVGLNPVNPVKMPKPLLIADLNPASNPATTPQQPRQAPSSELNDELELVDDSPSNRRTRC